MDPLHCNSPRLELLPVVGAVGVVDLARQLMELLIDQAQDQRSLLPGQGWLGDHGGTSFGPVISMTGPGVP